MSFNFTSVEHGFASVMETVYKEAKVAEGVIEKILPFLQKDKAILESVVGLIPGANVAVVVIRAAFAALGIVLAAVKNTEHAAASATVTIDASTVAEFKQLIESYKAELAQVEELFHKNQAPLPVEPAV